MTGPVCPGSGWPDDPATPSTLVARRGTAVRELAASAASLAELEARVSVCRACPRLVTWREHVAADKRRAYADQQYWGRPVPGWGDSEPRLLIVGLAPAAHGGNRTGRIFTGDRSGDVLFAALHRTGLADLPTSTHAGDGQRLRGTRMVAAVRCAPPQNQPTPEERHACEPWLHEEVHRVLPSVRAVVALGAFAWRSALAALSGCGLVVPRPRPSFGHGAETVLMVTTPSSRDPRAGLLLVGSYHPSQQNTFTGKLTEAMLDAVLARAASHASIP